VRLSFFVIWKNSTSVSFYITYDVYGVNLLDPVWDDALTGPSCPLDALCQGDRVTDELKMYSI